MRNFDFKWSTPRKEKLLRASLNDKNGIHFNTIYSQKIRVYILLLFWITNLDESLSLNLFHQIFVG